MNTLTGYSKSRLIDDYVLTAAGGHTYRQLVNPNPHKNFDLLFDTTPLLMNGVALSSSSPVVVSPDNGAPFGKSWYITSYTSWYPTDIIYFTPGETICIESWMMRPSGATGTEGSYYLGIQFRDKQGNAVSSNNGTVYTTSHSNWTCPSDGVWYRRYAEYTIPTSHTSYNGSDGGGYYSGTIRVLLNYGTGTIPTYYGGFRIYRKHIPISVTSSDIATSAIAVGDGTVTIVPQKNNEINFGGTYNSGTVYIGYRATDSKPIPTSFVFGGSTGSASLTATSLTSTGRLTLNATSTALYLTFNNDNTKSVLLNGTAFKPFDVANGLLTLGTTSARWSTVYAQSGNFTSSINVNSKLNIDSTGRITPASTSVRNAGVYGVYDSTKVGHVWSMGTGYAISDDGSNTGTMYGLVYFHTNWSNDSTKNDGTRTAVGTYAGGHQIALTSSGQVNASLGNYIWSRGGYKKEGSSNDYILLGGGGHKSISSFDDHYVTLTTTQTISGAKIFTTSIKINSGKGINDENGSGVLGIKPTSWTGVPSDGTAIGLGTISNSLYFRSSGDNMYHYRDDKGTPYKVLDAFNYSSYALPLTGGTLNSNITETVLYFATSNSSTSAGIVRGAYGFYLWNNNGGRLGLREDGTPHYNNNTLYHTGNLTKVSQLTNDSGFVTGGPYLPLTGGTIKNGTTRNPLTIDTTNSSGSYLNFATNGTITSYIGYHPTYGAFLETTEGSTLAINNKAASFNGSMTLAGALTLSGTTSATAILRFSRTGASTWNYILWPGDSNSDCKLAFGYNNTQAACYYYMTKDAIYPVVTSTQTLGTTNNRWLGFYSNTGDFLNDVTSGTKFKASNTNGAVSIFTSTNRGLYDETNGQWIIYISKDGSTVYVPKWASKGASDRPVYFNSNGIPTATTYRMAATNTAATTAVSIDSDTDTGIWYVSGTSSIIGPSDGVCISNKYSSLWISQIYQDYRTGKIAVRGKNSGTWTSWKKVAYEDDIPSVTSYYWADVPISSSPLTNTNPTFGSLIVDGLIRSKAGIIRPSASTTNAVSAITFYKGSSKSTEFNRDAVIGWFNEGGTNSNGAFYLVPYPQNTDPWATSVGLFISQTQLLFEGKTVYHSGNLSKSTIGLGNVQNTAFYKRPTYVNGTEWNMAGTTNGTAFTIYAPTTAGTSGQVLTSSGGTPGWTNQSSLSVGYASSAGNADTLDTYHADSFVLKRIQTVRPTGTAVGWYRCAQISSSNAGYSQNVIISLQRSYISPQNEHYIFAISIGYNGQVSINQLSGCVGGQRITKIRVVYNNSGNCYFDYYMDTSKYENSYRVEILAGDCISYQTPTLVSTADGTAVEFVPISGMKSNYSMYAPSFYQDSDQTLKTNIQTILNSDNMPIIKEFDWKSDGTHSYGLIAQELEEKGYYELVNTDGSGSKTVNYTAALSLIVGKLQNKIKELEKEIENLKNKN